MTQAPKTKTKTPKTAVALDRHRLLRAALDVLDGYDRGHVLPSMEALRELVDELTTPPPLLPRRKTAKRNQRKR